MRQQSVSAMVIDCSPDSRARMREAIAAVGRYRSVILSLAAKRVFHREYCANQL